MVNVGVKASDIGFQTADTARTTVAGVKNAQSEQFKKLLQGKQDELQESGAREVSKDAEQEKTEASEKAEKSEKPEESKGKDKDAGGDQKEETVSTDDSQTQGLLAAYQMDQGFRPELLTAEPEVVIEMPEAVEAMPEAAAVNLTGEMIAGDVAEQMDVQTAAAETAVSANIQAEVKPQETVQVKGPEVQAEAPETVDAAPVRRETVKSEPSREENQAQTNDHQAEQTAAAPVAQAPVRDLGEEVRPQEITTVHVAQPEELPEKLTDQILSKLEEGVQSFEIEIEPEQLGKIAVKILYEDGQATVSILCTEKKALDVLGNHAREIGGIIDRNLGGETKIFVEKQEQPDYLNQNRDENQQGRQEEQEQQKEGNKKQDSEDSEQFLQKLRLGLMG